MPGMARRTVAVVSFACCAVLGAGAQQLAQPPAPQAPVTNLGNDANGNPLRRATKTGHVSNYDETKVPPYTLPDPLVLANGKPVKDAETWRRERRPEIMRLYETEIFGRVPASAPKVTWRVTGTEPAAREGTVTIKRVIGTTGEGATAPKIPLTLYTPAKAKGRVPIILLVNFGGLPAVASAQAGAAAPPLAAGATPNSGEPPIAADILARGWGYATIFYQDIQPDRRTSLDEGIIAFSRAPGQTHGPEDWGAISAWSWGASRAIDYLETDPAVNARQIALFGHSRLGKTALWASANDPRIAAIFVSCAGEMGSALSRRDFGETVDDMTQNFPWWFSGTFQKWAGRWNEMPVDAHMLIALSAPRPVFLTGGTRDQWADPVGIHLAAIAAGPVYRLLGKKDLGSSQPPPLDTPLTSGDLGWYYHTGAHAATPEDWKAFVVFLAKYFK